MPRQARLLLPHSYYHVMARGNNKNIIFRTNEDYYYFLDLIVKYKLEHPFDLYHYCLMPNHIHFLIRISKSNDFSTFMKKLNLAYFHHYNQNYGWVGHFWQDRFKSQAIGKDPYFIQCGKYIELNPVRAGLVNHPKDYRFSSYQHYANGKRNTLITNDIFYREIGKNNLMRQENYQKIIVDEIVIDNYLKPIWGSRKQRYNERNKSEKYFKRHK